MRDHVLPGNKEFVEGDTIPRPPGGAGGGGVRGRPDGGGEDDFRFVLSREEFLDLFLDDLELPDLAKRRLASDRDSPACAGRATRCRARRPTSRSPARCATACRAASRCSGRSRTS